MFSVLNNLNIKEWELKYVRHYKTIDHITLPRFVKAHQIFEHNELTEEEIGKKT